MSEERLQYLNPNGKRTGIAVHIKGKRRPHPDYRQLFPSRGNGFPDRWPLYSRRGTERKGPQNARGTRYLEKCTSFHTGLPLAGPLPTLYFMICRNTRYEHRRTALSILAVAVLSTNQLHAETPLDTAGLRQIHNQQAIDLRWEQQRHQSAHKPVTPGGYLRLEERYREERSRQWALHARQLRDARVQGRIRGDTGALTHRPSGRIRYQQQRAAQRLEFKLNRRP